MADRGRLSLIDDLLTPVGEKAAVPSVQLSKDAVMVKLEKESSVLCTSNALVKSTKRVSA